MRAEEELWKALSELNLQTSKYFLLLSKIAGCVTRERSWDSERLWLEFVQRRWFPGLGEKVELQRSETIFQARFCQALI